MLISSVLQVSTNLSYSTISTPKHKLFDKQSKSTVLLEGCEVSHLKCAETVSNHPELYVLC
jgi:hypothetical protein